MKKRLGAIPKGLEWISQETQEPLIVAQTEGKKSFAPVATAVSSARRGLQEDLTRATFIIQEEHLEKIKAYAYWERMQIKDVLAQMCEQFFDSKKIRSVPLKTK
jgi:hypothetical protein